MANHPNRNKGGLKQFVVIRYGSNAANQSMCPRAACGFVYAADSDAAKRVAKDGGLTVYNNQYLEAVEISKARAADRREAYEYGEIQPLYPNLTAEEAIKQAR